MQTKGEENWRKENKTYKKEEEEKRKQRVKEKKKEEMKSYLAVGGR